MIHRRRHGAPLISLGMSRFLGCPSLWPPRDGRRPGAFLLAAAGVLDGRRATTHWYCGERLQSEHPRVEVDTDAIYADLSLAALAGRVPPEPQPLRPAVRQRGRHVPRGLRRTGTAGGGAADRRMRRHSARPRRRGDRVRHRWRTCDGSSPPSAASALPTTPPVRTTHCPGAPGLTHDHEPRIEESRMSAHTPEAPPVVATVGIFIWPDMTMLDVLGPHQALGLTPGSGPRLRGPAAVRRPAGNS